MKKKIIAIGDIHGRDVWRKIPDADRVVFVGDYFDSRSGISGVAQLENFFDICHYKMENPEKVVLLLGNHDYHYLRGVSESYTGYQPLMRFTFELALHEARNKGLMQWVYLEDGFLFSHAGVTKTWLKANGGDLSKINDLPDKAFRFNPGDNDSPVGDDVCQSPIWVRPGSLEADRLESVVHVVGHTMQDGIGVGDDVIYIDALESGEYLEITDGVLKAREI